MKAYTSLDDFLAQWSAADQKSAVIEALEETGVFFEELAEAVGRDYEPFDLVAHVDPDELLAELERIRREGQQVLEQLNQELKIALGDSR